jgi:quinol-cytochrome oxidoreductase complex cytochrome b subunit
MAIIREDVLKLFKKERRSTFINHLWSVVWDHQVPVGEIRNNKILLWEYDWFNPIAYLVFIFEFDEQEKLQKVKTELTTYNKLMFTLIITASIAYAVWVGYAIYLENSNYTILFIIIFFDTLCLVFALNIYKVSKNNQTVDIRNFLTQVAKRREEIQRSRSHSL